MMRALFDGRKTQTRRILKPQPEATWGLDPARWHAARVGSFWFTDVPDQPGNHCICARYAPGDRLWVRESFYQFGHWEPIPGKLTKGGRQKWRFVTLERDEVLFAPPPGLPLRLGRHHKDPSTPAWHKRLGRFMPRKFSRLTLIVEAMKVERLQDISEADAIAEGATWRPECAGFQFRDIGWSMDWKEPSRDHALVTAPDAFGAFINELHGGPHWNLKSTPSLWQQNPWVVAVTFRVEHRNIDSVHYTSDETIRAVLDPTAGSGTFLTKARGHG